MFRSHFPFTLLTLYYTLSFPICAIFCVFIYMAFSIEMVLKLKSSIDNFLNIIWVEGT